MKAPTRLEPRIVIRQASPNVSSRTTAISLIVLHSTESANAAGNADLAGVAGWFANPGSQVSAHIITDADGHSAVCVADVYKAWACVAYNSPSLNIEQIGRAAQPEWEHDEWIETARWIAQFSHDHRIPIRRARTAFGRVLLSGVTTHKKLGAAGGGHTDPGPAYPLRSVLKMARAIKRARYG